MTQGDEQSSTMARLRSWATFGLSGVAVVAITCFAPVKAAMGDGSLTCGRPWSPYTGEGLRAVCHAAAMQRSILGAVALGLVVVAFAFAVLEARSDGIVSDTWWGLRKLVWLGVALTVVVMLLPG